jgi:AsmA protein
MALPIAAIGIAVAVIEPNDYKPDIIAAVQDATGRTLNLNGPLRVSRSLWPTIEVNDVALANLQGGTRPDMAHANRIEARLSLPALLWHQIEVAELTLIGPNILFEQVGGTSNWLLNPPDVANRAPVRTPGTPFRLRIRNVHVQDGMVTSRLPARTRVIGIKSLDLAHHTDGGPLDLTAVLVYADNKPFSLKASARPTAGITGPWNTQLQFAAFDTTASATGTMDVAGGYDLQVAARSGALEALNALLPEMQLPALHGLTLSARVTNGPVLGDLPTFGATKLHFDGADLSDRVNSLKLNATDISLASAGAMAGVSSTGQFAGQPLTLKGSFGVPPSPSGRISVPIDLIAQTISSGGTAAASGSVALKGKLALNKFQFAGLDATAAVRTPALASLDPILARSLPALTDVRFDGRVVIPAKAGPMRFVGARLQTQEGDVSGDGTIERGADLALTVKLHANRIDLDKVLGLAGIGSAAVSEHPAGSVIPDTPLPWAALRGPTLDISGSVGVLTYQGDAFQNLDFALHLKGSRISLGKLKLSLPGGPLALSMTADASTDPGAATLSVQAPTLPLALIARTAGLSDSVQGVARIEVQLRGTGRSAHELAASLEGPFSVTVLGGALSNAAFVKLASASLDALGIAVPARGETTLHCLGLVGVVSKGVAKLRTIALDTTYLELSGVGEVDLGKETVAFKLTPLAQISGSPVSVPVLVEGPFRAIKGWLDATGLDQLGLLIDSLFGGDDPDTCTDAGLVPHHPAKP